METEANSKEKTLGALRATKHAIFFAQLWLVKETGQLSTSMLSQHRTTDKYEKRGDKVFLVCRQFVIPPFNIFHRFLQLPIACVEQKKSPPARVTLLHLRQHVIRRYCGIVVDTELICKFPSQRKPSAMSRTCI